MLDCLYVNEIKLNVKFNSLRPFNTDNFPHSHVLYFYTSVLFSKSLSLSSENVLNVIFLFYSNIHTLLGRGANQGTGLH